MTRSSRGRNAGRDDGCGQAGADPAVPAFSVGLDGVIRSHNRAGAELLGLAADENARDLGRYLSLAGEERLPLQDLAAQSFWNRYSATIRRGPNAGKTIRFRARGVADASGRLGHVIVVGEGEAELRAIERLRRTARIRVGEGAAAPGDAGPAGGSAPAAAGARAGSAASGHRPEPAEAPSAPGGEDGDVLRRILHRIDSLAAVEEVLRLAGRSPSVSADALVGTMLRRVREANAMRDGDIEHSVDATRVPVHAVPAVCLVVHEVVSLLLAARLRARKGDTIRIVLWSGADGGWRLVARSIGERQPEQLTPSPELASLLAYLGGRPLPSGFSGSGVALSFARFGSYPAP